MGIHRRFSGWRDMKTGKAVNIDDVIKKPSTGDFYIVKGFSFAKGQRVKVLQWDRRVTGIPEFHPAEDFGLEFV